MKKSILDEFRLTVAEKRLNVYGVTVCREGEEALSHRFRADERLNIYSCSKTFASIGVGICLDEGRFQLEDRVLGFFPEYKDAAADGSEYITLRDLLHMTSGKQSVFYSQEAQSDQADWAELFFSQPLFEKPGVYFDYNNDPTYMLGRVIEKVTGQTLRDFLVPRLFEPLEINNPQWHTCPRGHTLCATELYLTTEELSRLGILLLNKGIYNGKRIVSCDYVQHMTSDLFKTDRFTGFGGEETQEGYGYQVWMCTKPGVFRAQGIYGQFIVVVPEKRAVIAVSSFELTGEPQILKAILDDIVPNLD